MFILVRIEYPYVQSATATRVINTERFVVGGPNGRERDRSQVSDGKVKKMPRARLLVGCVLCVESIHPFSGVPYPPFYRPRGSSDYRGEKEEKLEAEKVFQMCRDFLFLHAGPTNMLGGNRDSPTLGACPLILPCPGIISGS